MSHFVDKPWDASWTFSQQQERTMPDLVAQCPKQHHAWALSVCHNNHHCMENPTNKTDVCCLKHWTLIQPFGFVSLSKQVLLWWTHQPFIDKWHKIRFSANANCFRILCMLMFFWKCSTGDATFWFFPHWSSSFLQISQLCSCVAFESTAFSVPMLTRHIMTLFSPFIAGQSTLSNSTHCQWWSANGDCGKSSLFSLAAADKAICACGKVASAAVTATVEDPVSSEEDSMVNDCQCLSWLFDLTAASQRWSRQMTDHCSKNLWFCFWHRNHNIHASLWIWTDVSWETVRQGLRIAVFLPRSASVTILVDLNVS